MVCDGWISCLVPFHSHCSHTVDHVEHCMYFVVLPKTKREKNWNHFGIRKSKWQFVIINGEPDIHH